jgi:4-amino-4-deoxy-L-arabinose transferase-like glycosyltransferase
MVKKRVELLVCLAVVVLAFGRPLFVGLGNSDFENDEALHSMIAESIVRTGDWMTPHSFVPHLSPEFVEKPPLKFWLVAAPIRAGLVTASELGFRIWDALFGAVAFLYVFGLGRRVGGSWAGLSAVLVLFTFHPIVFEHGLRTNNMDAGLVAAYCGGMYHLVGWARAAPKRAALGHALAAGGWFYVGLMTKFVAVAFLPAVAGLVAVMHAPTRSRVLAAWRTWLAVAVAVLALAAPWFVYQTLRSGWDFWQIILGDHVVKRFSTGLDPEHLKPWPFYFQFFLRELARAHSLWLVVGGGLVVLWRTVREDWLEGSLLLFWFWLPVALMSLGSSKLAHYSYPFVPPLALWAGSGLSWAGRLVASRLPAAWRTDRWPTVAMAAVACLLVAAGPARSYPDTVKRLGTESHTMRTLGECMRRVRAYQASVGQRQPPLFVWLPTGYQHSYFYYFGDLGWDEHEAWNDDALVAALDDSDAWRAVLMPERHYDRFLERTGRTPTMVATRRVYDSIMLLPGPLSVCGQR